MVIRVIEQSQKQKAIDLIIDTFMHFVAPDYSQEGIDAFKTFLYDKKLSTSLEMYGAYENDKIVGVIATRNSGSHIVLLFVDKNYQHMGIAKKLFDNILKNFESEIITVNSSPFAVNAYKRLGFKITKNQQIKDGIKFIPMVYKR